MYHVYKVKYLAALYVSIIKGKVWGFSMGIMYLGKELGCCMRIIDLGKELGCSMCIMYSGNKRPGCSIGII